MMRFRCSIEMCKNTCHSFRQLFSPTGNKSVWEAFGCASVHACERRRVSEALAMCAGLVRAVCVYVKKDFVYVFTNIHSCNVQKVSLFHKHTPPSMFFVMFSTSQHRLPVYVSLYHSLCNEFAIALSRLWICDSSFTSMYVNYNESDAFAPMSLYMLLS